jgi:predicted CoA-binding protein
VSTRTLIDNFLARKRFAMVGVSRNEKDFSRALFRAFCESGYDAVPVNPGATEMEGRKCYPTIGEAPDVEAALLMTPAKLTLNVVRACAEAGVKTVWMYQAVGAGAVSPEAVKFCESNGVGVIAGYCPFMFLKGGSFPHNVHAIILKMVGKYPS